MVIPFSLVITAQHINDGSIDRFSIADCTCYACYCLWSMWLLAGNCLAGNFTRRFDCDARQWQWRTIFSTYRMLIAPLTIHAKVRGVSFKHILRFALVNYCCKCRGICAFDKFSVRVSFVINIYGTGKVIGN